MCGIAGVVRFRDIADPLDLSELRHRGPDSFGEWNSADRRVWLGHTRLAILDLTEAGAQPMIDPLTGTVLVFNGEIYNHLELRKELAAHGVVWRGSSDSETLLMGYRVWGRGLIERLEGMFAFALFDLSEGGVLLVRDRCGIKPLYLIQTLEGVRFSSEVRPLRAYLDSALQPQKVAAYLAHGCCPDETLLFQGLELLPAGEWLWLGLDGMKERGAYSPPLLKLSPASGDPVRRVRELLEEAVRSHLIADVPVACFLSGGLDSSILTALASKQLGAPLQTFSVGFEQEVFDESRFAALVAARCGARHEEILLSPEEALSSVREAIERMDLPSVDAINTYIVARAVARRGIKVALSGLGADELFGGYPSFQQVPLLKWVARTPSLLRRCVGRFTHHSDRLRDLSASDVGSLVKWRRKFWTQSMLEESGIGAAEYAIDLPVPDLPDDFARTSWAEMSGYMRSMLLRDSDQMSMSVSLEIRVPFLDRSLVDYVLALPRVTKRANPHPKQLLIEACRDLLPPEILTRKKQGFALPMREWMAGPLSDLVAEGIAEVVRRGLLDSAFLWQMQQAVVSGKTHWTRLWSVVVLGLYLQKWEIKKPLLTAV